MTLREKLASLGHDRVVQLRGKYWVRPSVALHVFEDTPLGQGYLGSQVSTGSDDGFETIVIHDPTPWLAMDRIHVANADAVYVDDTRF